MIHGNNISIGDCESAKTDNVIPINVFRKWIENQFEMSHSFVDKIEPSVQI